MANNKTVAMLAGDLEKLEKSRDEAIAQREAEPVVTIKIIGSPDIELSRNQKLFFDGLIHTINTTIDQTKHEIRDLMFPEKQPKQGV